MDNHRVFKRRRPSLEDSQKWGVYTRMEIELAELKAAKEKAESEASAAFEAGKGAAFKEYVDEVPKFENWGFKHGWLKALDAAGVTLALPIPYEQVDVEPLESDPED